MAPRGTLGRTGVASRPSVGHKVPMSLALARRSRLVLGLAIALVLASSALRARQDDGGTQLTAVLARMDAYLVGYEAAISNVVADEVFSQHFDGGRRVGMGSAATAAGGPAADGVRVTRRLESEVAFLRLPGDADWLAHRRVRRVAGRPVEDGPALAEVLARSGVSAYEQARAIVQASARHNLGSARTTNVPTFPLELAHPRRRASYTVHDAGRDRIDGRVLRKLRLAETSPPSIVANGPRGFFRTEVTLWVAPETGAIHRALAVLDPPFRAVARPSIRVDFMRDEALGLLVPREMDEEFVLGVSQGFGRAVYSNYRRFQTSGRLVPQ
jgi:hypothetical protein